MTALLDGARPRPSDLAVVTGLHRSGTTFLGNILDTAQRTTMLTREPTNRVWGVKGVPRWYPELTEADLAGDTPNAPAVARLLRLSRGRPIAWNHEGSSLRAIGTSIVQSSIAASVRPRSHCLVVKDPFLSLSVPFVQRHLTSRTVLVAVRHPAAWALSLERVDWHPGSLVRQLLARPEMADDIAGLEVPTRDWEAQPLYEASAWAWLILMTIAERRAAVADPDRHRLVPLESFKDDPVELALSLIDEVGLERGPQTLPRVRELTEGAVVAPTTTEQHVLQRDTRASVESWRRRMSAADQRAIWTVCEPVAHRFYQP